MFLKNPKKYNAILISLLIFSILFFILNKNIYAKTLKETINEYNFEFNKNNLDFLNDNIDDSEIFITYSLKENNIILMQNENVKINPASITKIVPCILAIKNLDLNKKIQVTQDDTEIPNRYVKVPLIPGETFTVEELLHFALIPSCNDATKVLARALNDEKSSYDEKVKELFKNLNMENTNFTNSYGYADPNHYTTLSDLVKLTKYALNDKVFLSIISKSYVNIPPYENRTQNIKKTTNKYLLDGKFKDPNIFGVKTGYNDLSKYCLVSAKNIVVRNKPDEIICIVANQDIEENRYNLSNKLYSYTEQLLENKVNTSLKWSNLNPKNLYLNAEQYLAYLVVILIAVLIFKPRRK